MAIIGQSISSVVCSRQTLRAEHETYHRDVIVSFDAEGRFPGWIPIEGVKKSIYPVIYNQYLCATPVSQLECTMHHTNKRNIRYFYHCHCQNHGSLQCMAMRRVVSSYLHTTRFSAVGDYYYTPTPICCNTWNCSPFACYGIIFCDGSMYFFARMSMRAIESFRAVGDVSYEIYFVTLSDGTYMAVAKPPNCSPVRMVVARIKGFFDMIRLFTSCSFGGTDASLSRI